MKVATGCDRKRKHRSSMKIRIQPAPDGWWLKSRKYSTWPARDERWSDFPSMHVWTAWFWHHHHPRKSLMPRHDKPSHDSRSAVSPNQTSATLTCSAETKKFSASSSIFSGVNSCSSISPAVSAACLSLSEGATMLDIDYHVWPLILQVKRVVKGCFWLTALLRSKTWLETKFGTNGKWITWVSRH